MKTRAAYQEEFVSATKELTLPHGSSWPQKGPKFTVGSQFGDGVGQEDAEYFWLCAWQGEWLKQHAASNETKAAQALSMLRTFTKSRAYTEFLDPGGIELFDKEISDAGLGDPARVQEDFTVNCDAPSHK